MEGSQLHAASEALLEKISEARSLYYRLVLVVGPPGSGKTAVLQDLSKRIGVHVINLSLELSRRLLDLTERQRALETRGLLAQFVKETGEQMGTGASHVVLLDNIELLFDSTLKQDPLRLLQASSRNTTVVAAWPGSVVAARPSSLVGNQLTYAVPGHPEYRRYPDPECLIFCPGHVL